MSGQLFVGEQLPLKQGLKLNPDAINGYKLLHVGEQLPLKQGLKPYALQPCLAAQRVGEQLPLKQGLKQNLKHCKNAGMDGWRATSIKTRIETTILTTDQYSCKMVGEQLPLKQGLKLLSTSIVEGIKRLLESNFH